MARRVATAVSMGRVGGARRLGATVWEAAALLDDLDGRDEPRQMSRRPFHRSGSAEGLCGTRNDGRSIAAGRGHTCER
jgi:hypothetical protein